MRAEREIISTQEQKSAKAALTELFLEMKTDQTPAIVERIVTEIDEIVKIVRFDGWQTFVTGEREVQKSLRKTLIAQTDHSIQRHYDNYNDPELVAKVQLAHLRIMHHFKIIELYELWLRKIEELFGAQNSDLYVGGSSDFVYHDQLKRLEGILKIDRTKISKDPFWIDKF